VKEEIVVKSFKKCCISNALDGTEDDVTVWRQWKWKFGLQHYEWKWKWNVMGIPCKLVENKVWYIFILNFHHKIKSASYGPKNTMYKIQEFLQKISLNTWNS
jgi:hypothetical protein